jgi:phenylpyruvate tautomerase PptA (4-oxalocrotonate tautomerase family)
MPLVQVTLRKGKPPQFIRAAGTAIQEALVEHAKIPAGDHFQIFHEVDAGNLIADDSFAGLPPTPPVERSEGLIIIQITLNEGRTDITKAAIYHDVAARLQALGVRPDDIFISLIEVAKQNWSMASGVMTYPT